MSVKLTVFYFFPTAIIALVTSNPARTLVTHLFKCRVLVERRPVKQRQIPNRSYEKYLPVVVGLICFFFFFLFNRGIRGYYYSDNTNTIRYRVRANLCTPSRKFDSVTKVFRFRYRVRGFRSVWSRTYVISITITTTTIGN